MIIKGRVGITIVIKMTDFKTVLYFSLTVPIKLNALAHFLDFVYNSAVYIITWHS